MLSLFIYQFLFADILKLDNLLVWITERYGVLVLPTLCSICRFLFLFSIFFFLFHRHMFSFLIITKYINCAPSLKCAVQLLCNKWSQERENFSGKGKIIEKWYIKMSTLPGLAGRQLSQLLCSLYLCFRPLPAAGDFL